MASGAGIKKRARKAKKKRERERVGQTKEKTGDERWARNKVFIAPDSLSLLLVFARVSQISRVYVPASFLTPQRYVPFLFPVFFGLSVRVESSFRRAAAAFFLLLSRVLSNSIWPRFASATSLPLLFFSRNRANKCSITGAGYSYAAPRALTLSLSYSLAFSLRLQSSGSFMHTARNPLGFSADVWLGRASIIPSTPSSRLSFPA